MITFFFALSFALYGCGGGGNSTPDPNAGFMMQTFAANPGPNGAPLFPTAAELHGDFLQANGTTTGTQTSFEISHGGVGNAIAHAAKVPARWRITIGPNIPGGGSLCLTFATTDHDVSLNSVVPLTCPGRAAGIAASPGSIDALNPPSTVTFGGDGIENADGTSRVAFYNEFGYVIATAQATQIWSNGAVSGVSVATPDLSQVYDGVYTVVIQNVLTDGSLDVVGSGQLTIYGNPPPPPPPPDDGGGGDCQSPRSDPQLECEPILN